MRSKGIYPQMLRMVNVPIKGIKKCQEIYREFQENFTTQVNVNIGMNICAGRFGKDSCKVRY